MLFIYKDAITGSGLDTIFTKSSKITFISIIFLIYMHSAYRMIIAKTKAELVPAFSLDKHMILPA